MAIKVKIRPNGNVYVETGNYVRSRYNTEPSLGGVRTQIEDSGLDWNDFVNNTDNEVLIGNNLDYYNNQLKQYKSQIYGDISQAEFDVLTDGIVLKTTIDKAKKIKDKDLDGTEVTIEMLYPLLRQGFTKQEMIDFLGTTSTEVDNQELKVKQDLKDRSDQYSAEITLLRDSIDIPNITSPIKPLIKGVKNMITLMQEGIDLLQEDINLIDTSAQNKFDSMIIVRDETLEEQDQKLRWAIGEDAVSIQANTNIGNLNTAQKLIDDLDLQITPEVTSLRANNTDEQVAVIMGVNIIVINRI